MWKVSGLKHAKPLLWFCSFTASALLCFFFLVSKQWQIWLKHRQRHLSSLLLPYISLPSSSSSPPPKLTSCLLLHWPLKPNGGKKVDVHSINPKWSNMLSSTSVKQPAVLHRKTSDLKASPIFAGARGNSVALCGPVCIYEWLSLGVKPQNNAATLKDWFSYGRGVGDGDDDGGGEGSLFPTVGAWYREWREVLLATGWRDALNVSVRRKTAGTALTGAAERLDVGHGYLYRWGAAIFSE